MTTASGNQQRAPQLGEREVVAERRALTERQRLMWLEHALHPRVPTNNMVTTFRIAADVDHPRLVDALASVIARSDALRTVFERVDGQPTQRVLDALDPRCELVDLSRSADPEPELARWLDERRQRPFRLSERAIDTALLRLGPRDTLWYLDLHHLITDAWSCALVYRHTLEAYLGKGDPHAPLPAYSEWIDERERRAASPEWAASEAFWRARLREAPPPLRFYQQRSLARRSAYLERRTIRLDAARMQGLGAAARALTGQPATDASLATVLTTLVLAYVHRVTGNRVIGIGSPMLNRPHKRARETIGAFIEICPLRVEVEAGDTFASLFAKVRREMLAILPHARHTVSNPSHARAFEVMVNHHVARFPALLGPTRTDFTTGTVGLSPGAPRIAEGLIGPEAERLVVTAQDFDSTGALEITLDLAEDSFDPETRREAVGHFLRIVDALIEGTSTPIERVRLLSEEERQVLFAPLERTRVTRSPDETVLDLLEARALERPEHVAVAHRDRTLSYGALVQAVEVLAQRLSLEGAGPGARVAVSVERSIEMLIAILATLRTGAAYVPLDPAHPPSRTRDILEDAAPRILVTSRALAGSLAEGTTDAKVVLVDEPYEARSTPLPRPSGEDLAYVIFTSGSTGRPKGVEIPHAALTNFLRSMAHEPGLDASDRVLAITTLTFDIAALELLLPLTVGATVEIADRELAVDGARLTARLSSTPEITLLQATPATWRMLVEAGLTRREHLRGLIGGEALPLPLARRLVPLVRELWNVYGPTETTVWSTLHRVDEAALEHEVAIGHPIDNTRTYVLGVDREPLPVGVIGELWIGGAGVARGYLDRPELTSERFVPDPYAGHEGARMYRTGDLASLDREGQLRYHGRADRQIKLRGFRIEPGEIEHALSSHPDVRAAIVLVREVGGDPRLVAYVAADPSAELPATLRALARERLPEIMVPAHVVTLEALPLTPSGKIDVKALPSPEPSANDAGRPEGEPPATDVEVLLASLFGELLGVPRVSRSDDFFELGGHSLLALTLAQRVQRELGVELSIALVLERRTVASIAEAITAERTTPPSIVTLLPPRSGASPTPLFFVCGIQIYQDLARSLGAEHPSYGLFVPVEERLLRDVSAGVVADVHISVEELAREYVAVLRAHRPRGPYRLAGISFGGVLAYAMARRLEEEGERVELVVLLDSVLPRARARSHLRWVLAQLGSVRTSSRGALRARLDRGLTRMWPALARLVGSSPPPPMTRDERSIAALRESIYMRAIGAYDRSVRGGCACPVLLFRARDRDEHASVAVAPDCGWRSLVRGALEIVDIPGDHLSIVQGDSARRIADALRARLDELDRASATEAAQ